MRNVKIELKWAAIFVLMMLAWMLLERLGGFHDSRIEQHAIVTNFVAIPAIVVYVLALLDKRKNHYGGKMTYVQGLVTGLIITLFVTLVSPLTQYITTEIITPDYFKNMIKYTVNNDMMSIEEARANFNLKSYMVQTVIGTPIMGAVTSAVVAIFTRKK